MSIYAISDLHGCLDLYKQVKEFLKPEDKVYCLGDCGDRGPNSWETIKAVANDPQFIYLMGNHEHMLLAAMNSVLGYPQIGDCIFYNDPEKLLYTNGGYSTLVGWQKDGKEVSWIDYFSNLKRIEFYKNADGIDIILCHAGYCPIDTPTDYDLIWDRSHFWSPWPKSLDNAIMVHGHTPCEYLSEDLNMLHGPEYRKKWAPIDGAIWYADGHKIDIDMGSFYTNTTLLLDLDTFEEHIFIIDK